jgi:hypothetical protein
MKPLIRQYDRDKRGFISIALILLLVSAIVTIIGSSGIGGTIPDNGGDGGTIPDNGGNGDTPGNNPRPYVLAYRDNNHTLRIRWSNDGTTWASAEHATPTINAAPGIATYSGTLYLGIFLNSDLEVRRISADRASAWDPNTYTIGNGHIGEIQSGTNVSHVSSNQWLVAYKHTLQAKIVTYDNSTGVKDFGAEVTPTAQANNNIIDKPAMVNRSGRILVSWLMPQGQLQIVPGNIQNGQPVWESGYLFNPNFPEQGYGPPIGAHDLAYDAEKFYLGIVRIKDPDVNQQVDRYYLFIYTSTNGVQWEKLSQIEIFESPDNAALSIAARGEDDLIAIISRPDSTQVPGTHVRRFNGSNWLELTRDSVFGEYPIDGGHDFTLIAVN